jgi:peptidoglycan hydrolase-like protein with peptidoglycan-binding domain
MKAFRITTAIFIALALPIAAFAQTSSDSSESSLLAQISALEQEIQSLSTSAGEGAATTNASVSSPAVSAQIHTGTSSGECPDLSRSLSIGMIGPDVAGLQTFLAQQGLFNAIATGYFGTLTQSAVAQWQENNGIVIGGSAATTGLGVVGPRTRAAMESSCQPGSGTASSASQCTNVLPPTTECPSSWQPVTDPNGCTMYYQCSVALPTAPATTQTATSSAPVSCPVVEQPVCSGTVEPFQTSSDGCVSAYECVL